MIFNDVSAGMKVLQTDSQTISECLRAPITRRLAHRSAHSIGRPGGHVPTNSTAACPPPAAPFNLFIQWVDLEMFKPEIKTIRSNL